MTSFCHHPLCSVQTTADISVRIRSHDMACAIQFMNNSVHLSHSLKETFCVCLWNRKVFRYFASVSVRYSDLSLYEAQCITILRLFHRYASLARELKRVMEVREEGWRPKKSRKGSSFIGAFQSVHCHPVSLSKQNIGSKTVKYTGCTHFDPTHNLVLTICPKLHSTWDSNVLEPKVLSAGSRATRTKTAVSGKPNSLIFF